jgi:hypothetical protein
MTPPFSLASGSALGNAFSAMATFSCPLAQTIAIFVAMAAG